MFETEKKERMREVVRAVVPYPAVFQPNEFGGWDVYFPNFPSARPAGINRRLAMESAEAELTTCLYECFRDRAEPPRPSRPENLLPDEDEVSGSQVVMIQPDAEEILRRLKLQKKRRRTAATGEKYNP